MIQLKHINLSNYRGYQSLDLDIKKWMVLFGPNGSFKTSFLDAVRMLSTSLEYTRDCSLLFRKITYHPDYKPGYESFERGKTIMRMEGIFDTDEGEKKVILQNDWTPSGSGVILNELKDISLRPTIFTDADNPTNMHRFQLIADYKKQFLDVAESVYGLKCYLDTQIENMTETYVNKRQEKLSFITDFIIEKPGGTKVHFRSMSAGERKIATLLRTLFNDCYEVSDNLHDIILIDNVVMHIYYQRHLALINKLKEYFPDKQFIVTTHSPILIEKLNKSELIDMEKII